MTHPLTSENMAGGRGRLEAFQDEGMSSLKHVDSDTHDYQFSKNSCTIRNHPQL